MKKFSYLFVCLVLICSVLTGCQEREVTEKETETPIIRIGSLKGPTTLGLLSMIEEQRKVVAEDSDNIKYEFQMMTAADELLPLMIKGELDIALIPANVASILYGKMNGNLRAIDINTLGVLYMVSGNTEINELKDLEGQTVYLTGKGTTPDYVLRYLLAQADVNIEEINFEFKAEATEVAAMLAQKPEAVGLLPQPFVTAALAQNEKLSVVLDLTQQWDMLQGNVQEASGVVESGVEIVGEAAQGSRMVTGVTVVRKEFLEQYPDAVSQFLKDHAESTGYVNDNVDQAAVWAVEQGIIAKETLAKKAIPQCNIVCITGEDMKSALSGYLQALYEQSAEAVGGKLPAEDFYFVE